MEPHVRLAAVGMWIAPGIARVGLSGDQSPVDGNHVVAFEQGHDGAEETALCARHIFCASQGTTECLELLDLLLVVDGVMVVVIRDDVGVAQLKVVEWLEIFSITPNAGSQRLLGVALAGPNEHIAQQRQRRGAMMAVARLIIEVPHEYTAVVAEGRENILNIAHQLRIELGGV